MAYDLESLLTPVSEDDPGGPDLSVENRRLTWIDAFDQRPEMDPVTGEMTEPGDIDWAQIKRDLVAELAQTKDVWLAAEACEPELTTNPAVFYAWLRRNPEYSTRKHG